MPILAKVPLALEMSKEPGGYDNRQPRAQQQRLTGFGARAMAAHQNCFEALVMFAPGALAVIATGTTGYLAQNLALAFIVARIAYLLTYWFDLHVLRSILWAVGFISSLALIYLAIP